MAVMTTTTQRTAIDSQWKEPEVKKNEMIDKLTEIGVWLTTLEDDIKGYNGELENVIKQLEEESHARNV